MDSGPRPNSRSRGYNSNSPREENFGDLLSYLLKITPFNAEYSHQPPRAARSGRRTDGVSHMRSRDIEASVGDAPSVAATPPSPRYRSIEELGEISQRGPPKSLNGSADAAEPLAKCTVSAPLVICRLPFRGRLRGEWPRRRRPPRRAAPPEARKNLGL